MELNELINTIYNSMIFSEIYQLLIFIFQKKPLLLCYDLLQVDKLPLGKQRWNFFFLFTWYFPEFGFSIWLDGFLQSGYFLYYPLF